MLVQLYSATSATTRRGATRTAKHSRRAGLAHSRNRRMGTTGVHRHMHPSATGATRATVRLGATSSTGAATLGWRTSATGNSRNRRNRRGSARPAARHQRYSTTLASSRHSLKCETLVAARYHNSQGSATLAASRDCKHRETRCITTLGTRGSATLAASRD